MTEPDDEALTWAGDEERQAPAKPRAAAAATPTSDAAAAPAATAGSTFGQSAVLVGYGIFAGIGVLYTVAWLFSAISFGRYGLFADPLQAGMASLGRWMAVLSPVLWGLAAFALLRERKPMVKLTWLLLGAIVLVPWPWLMGLR